MRPSEVTIVLAGAWNQAIFTPEWVQREVFATEGEVEVEVLFGGVSGLRYATPEVSLTVLPGRVQIHPARMEQAPLARAERVAVDLLTALPETPMQARGINVVVRQPAAGTCAGLFRDPPAIGADDAATIDVRRVGWRFRADADEVNVQAELSRQGFTLECNFHRAGSPASALLPTIDGQVAPCIARAQEIGRWLGMTQEGASS